MQYSAGYLSRLYEKYLADPSSVQAAWKDFFQRFPPELAGQLAPSDSSRGKAVNFTSSKQEAPSFSALDLLKTYFRAFAHQTIVLDPIENKSEKTVDKLIEEAGAYYGLVLDEKLKEQARQWLSQTYSADIGYEGLAWNDAPWKKWLCQEVESSSYSMKDEDRHHILQWLARAELFEKFLHTKFVGQKRFSLQGHETFIPMLYFLLRSFSGVDGQEVLIGMAHRGRLNVLAQILTKSYEEIIEEFLEYSDYRKEGSGDVKYHKGFEALWSFGEKKLNVRLNPNPSHLESVNPVVLGQAYAKAKELGPNKVLPILVHGDASFCGQGVVYESFQLRQIEGYRTGGCIHIILNNQVGFTAAAHESRSTHYCSDLAKTFDCPVLHVNVEKPESCVRVMDLALHLRQRFACDVVIDLVGYRRWGHNESDEPIYTQPAMYTKIRKKTSIKEDYKASLEERGACPADFGVYEKNVWDELQSSLDLARQNLEEKKKARSCEEFEEEIHWDKPSDFQRMLRGPKTAVSKKKLLDLAQKLWTLPPSFHAHRKIASLMETKLQSICKDQPLDWAACELLAYGSCIAESYRVRLSGQDSGRGTFSHRQALLRDQDSGKAHCIFAAIAGGEDKFEVYNSPLSEFAVLGFEYGISLARKKDLTIWEAQFGDFCNGAQVVIDQFLSSAQSKWAESSRLVLFLPHGYEGQGPEHSSARIERFLALSSRENWTVCNLSRPAQVFHLLRRQVLMEKPRPLVLFTPKGLLRHPQCQSVTKDLTDGKFYECILPQKSVGDASEVRSLVLCSGRVYYDIIAEGIVTEDVVVGTIEQLYPMPVDEILAFIETHPKIEQVIWIQEEPVNMGPMTWIRTRLWPRLRGSYRLLDIGRPRSSSIATGYPVEHKNEVKRLLDQLKQALSEPIKLEV